MPRSEINSPLRFSLGMRLSLSRLRPLGSQGNDSFFSRSLTTGPSVENRVDGIGGLIAMPAAKAQVEQQIGRARRPTISKDDLIRRQGSDLRR